MSSDQESSKLNYASNENTNESLSTGQTTSVSNSNTTSESNIIRSDENGATNIIESATKVISSSPESNDDKAGNQMLSHDIGSSHSFDESYESPKGRIQRQQDSISSVDHVYMHSSKKNYKPHSFDPLWNSSVTPIQSNCGKERVMFYNKNGSERTRPTTSIEGDDKCNPNQQENHMKNITKESLVPPLPYASTTETSSSIEIIQPQSDKIIHQIVDRLKTRRHRNNDPSEQQNENAAPGDGLLRVSDHRSHHSDSSSAEERRIYFQQPAADDGDSSTTDTWSIEDDNAHASKGHPNIFSQQIKRFRNKKVVRGTVDGKHTSLGGDGGNGGGIISMSAGDIAICQQLDAEYDRALEERDVTYTARYQSVRQSACLSIVFMALFMILGTVFFERQAPNWGLQESLLFTIYTITTVGYGHLETPDTPLFQLYTIFFIFIGIAVLTIMIAQVYQCVALEASRATTNTDSRSSMRALLASHIERAKRNRSLTHQAQLSAGLPIRPDMGVDPSTNEANIYPIDSALQNQGFDPRSIDDWSHITEQALLYLDHLVTFFRENEYGRTLAVFLPFVGLIVIGAMVIGPLEGWTVIQSLYFSVVSLTTVGFGDYYPTRPASIWFCIIWLPFSIGFMSLYFTNVAAFYLRLSDMNIERIERNLRYDIELRKERAEQERLSVLERAMRGQQKMHVPTTGVHATTAANQTHVHSNSAAELSRNHPANLIPGKSRRKGFRTVPLTEDSAIEDGANNRGISRSNSASSNSVNINRREQVLKNSQRFMRQQQAEMKMQDGDQPNNPNSLLVTRMSTMKDVLEAIHRNNEGHNFVSRSSSSVEDDSVRNVTFLTNGPESEFLSVRAAGKMKNVGYTGRIMKPSFALRALVQERFAEIIATDIAGYQSYIDIKDYTMSVTINHLKHTADKWLVPRRARKAFRAVAFEALYFVGEHGLITRGADALFALTPFEFHQIFAPLLAAFGDAETMEEWLMHTDILAEVDLRGANIVDLPDPLISPPSSPHSAGVDQKTTRSRQSVSASSNKDAQDNNII